jgi:hypothetical protein
VTLNCDELNVEYLRLKQMYRVSWNVAEEKHRIKQSVPTVAEKRSWCSYFVFRASVPTGDPWQRLSLL